MIEKTNTNIHEIAGQIKSSNTYNKPAVQALFWTGVLTYGVLDMATTLVGLHLGLQEANPVFSIFNEMTLIEVALVGSLSKGVLFYGYHRLMLRLDRHDTLIWDVVMYLFPLYVATFGTWVVATNIQHILRAIEVLYGIKIF